MAELQVAPPDYKHVYPQQPAGYPQQPAGYPQQPAGYQQQPAGYPPPVGHPQQPPPGYHPQPVGYPQQAPLQVAPQQRNVAANVVIVNQPAVPAVIRISFLDTPVPCTCPNCHNQVTSHIHWKVGTFAWLLALLIFVFGLWCGFCFIPLFLDGCKDAVHTCPVCNYQLGYFKRM